MSTAYLRSRRRVKGLPRWRIVRYADDFVVLVHGDQTHVEALREDVANVLGPLGLRLSESKSQVVHMSDGFDFLGFHIRWKRKRGTNKWHVYTFIAERPLRSVKAKIRALTNRKSQRNPGAVLVRINQILRGWTNYFRHAACKRTLSRLFHFVWWRVIRWLRAMHRWRWKDVRRRFTTPDGRWKPIEAEGITLFNPASVPVTRYRYRATPSPTPGPSLPLPDGSDRGEPGAWRRARRVRRAAWGNGSRVIPAPRPRPTQPENAIVLCADEKSSVQALYRTQASLPMTKGRGQTMTHDYKRNGTTTLFAALNVLTGMVIGQCLPRHRHQEFLKFLRTIDREVPNGLQIHLILDNYNTLKHVNVQQWLAKHPRFHLHFTPTSSSWLNQVERWFRELTDKALRRGTFASVPDLICSIQEYIDAHNKEPKPYKWTATAETILAKVARARTTLNTVN